MGSFYQPSQVSSLKRRIEEVDTPNWREPNLKVLITERWGPTRTENDIYSMIIGEIKAQRLKFGAPQTIEWIGNGRAVLRYALERDAAGALRHFRTPGVWFGGASIVAFYQGTKPPKPHPDKVVATRPERPKQSGPGGFPGDSRPPGGREYTPRPRSTTPRSSGLASKPYGHGSLTWRREDGARMANRLVSPPKPKPFIPGLSSTGYQPTSSEPHLAPEHISPLTYNLIGATTAIGTTPLASSNTSAWVNGDNHPRTDMLGGELQVEALEAGIAKRDAQKQSSEVDRFFSELGPPPVLDEDAHPDQINQNLATSNSTERSGTCPVIQAAPRTLLSFENSGRSSPVMAQGGNDASLHFPSDWGAVFRNNRDKKARAERERRVKDAEEKLRFLQIEHEMELIESGRRLEEAQVALDIRSALISLQQQLFPDYPDLVQLEKQSIKQALSCIFQAGRALGFLEGRTAAIPATEPVGVLEGPQSAESEEGEIN